MQTQRPAIAACSGEFPNWGKFRTVLDYVVQNADDLRHGVCAEAAVTAFNQCNENETNWDLEIANSSPVRRYV
jgi:hypothetical protein